MARVRWRQDARLPRFLQHRPLMDVLVGGDSSRSRALLLARTSRTQPCPNARCVLAAIVASLAGAKKSRRRRPTSTATPVDRNVGQDQRMKRTHVEHRISTPAAGSRERASVQRRAAGPRPPLNDPPRTPVLQCARIIMYFNHTRRFEGAATRSSSCHASTKGRPVAAANALSHTLLCCSLRKRSTAQRSCEKHRTVLNCENVEEHCQHFLCASVR